MGADHQGRRNEGGIGDVVPAMIAASRDVPSERTVATNKNPDAGHLLELFQMWTPDRATQQRILVDNPAKPHGFPN